MSVIRIGCLGAARVTPYAVLAPAKSRSDVEVVAVAARDRARAIAFAQKHRVRHVATSYEDLIAHDDIDVIYNALPPSAHASWSIAALAAGKHVLCEKPFCLNAFEARSMARAAEASGKLLLEAYHYRHHALMKRVVQLVRQNALGDIIAIAGAFQTPLSNSPQEPRLRRELGGGAMMDLGCYVLHAMRTISGLEPCITTAHAEMTGSVDRSMKAKLAFGDIQASLLAAMRPGPPSATLAIRGARASLRVHNFVAPQYGSRIELWTNGACRVLSAEGPTTYEAQLSYLVSAVNGDQDRESDLRDSVLQMEALDAIYQAAGI